MVGMKSRRVINQVQGLLVRGALGHLSDAQILDQFCLHRSDADLAFETLVLRHGPSVLHTCRRVLNDHGDAEDAFQATFLVLARRAGSLHPQDSVGPWLLGVARRIAMKARTAAIRRRFHEQRSAVPVIFDPATTRFDVHEPLRQAVDRLPEHLRAPIVLCYLERMSYKSAAEALALPEATVRGRLVKARDLLRQRLSHELEADCPSGRVLESSSKAPTIPLPLLDATTRSAVAFSNPVPGKTVVTPSVLRMAEGALTMLSATRFMRLMAATLVAIAGAAFAGLQAQVQPAPDVPAKALPAEPIREPPHEILIVADSIQTKAKDNQVLADGPGKMSLWVDREFLSGKLEDSPKDSREEPVLLMISWTQRMQLLARTTGAGGQPVCVVRFQGKVAARCGDRSITCEESMIVRTAQPVPLERIQLAMKTPASDTLARHSRTKIAGIDARRKVVVVGSIVDLDSKATVNRQRLIAEKTLSYDRRTGEFRVSGKGRIQLNAPAPEASKPDERQITPFEQTEISFNTGMQTFWMFEKNEAWLARHVLTITGYVTIKRPANSDTRSPVKPGSDRQFHGYMTADGLRLVVEEVPSSDGAPNRYRVRVTAEGKVKFVNGDTIIDARDLHYDSAEQ
jgi:RNA polymerase sigma factor (sigma-70 family)